MSIEKAEFAHACRRSRDEIVRAINAAASSHRWLPVLRAARAMAMMSRGRSSANSVDRRLRRIVDMCWLDDGAMR